MAVLCAKTTTTSSKDGNDKEITEDDLKRLLDQVQKATDENMSVLSDVAAAKEQRGSRRLMTTSVPRHVAIIMDGNGRWATGEAFLEARAMKRARRASVWSCVSAGSVASRL